VLQWENKKDLRALTSVVSQYSKEKLPITDFRRKWSSGVDIHFLSRF